MLVFIGNLLRNSIFLFFFFGLAACGILVPPPGIEPGPLAVEVLSPNHWTAKELLGIVSFCPFSSPNSRYSSSPAQSMSQLPWRVPAPVSSLLTPTLLHLRRLGLEKKSQGQARLG